MPDDKLVPPNDPEAARLAVGWEIVRVSDVQKNDPVHVAKVLGQVIQILRRAEAPQPAMEGDITVHAVSPRDVSASPGGTLHLTYNFSGGPAPMLERIS